MVGSEEGDPMPLPMDYVNADNSSSCSICLDLVNDKTNRSTARLQCGHEFHLDCIGSAFNMKGAMQCPNCRKVERGRWLFANGSTRSYPEFGMDDWISSEDPYELSYSEMPFGVHWCPFSGFARFHSSFEEVESPPITYHELQGNHAIFAEHTASSSLAHSYIAYLQPLPPASTNSSENVDDNILSHRWNGLSGHNEIYIPSFPANSIQHQSWGRHSPPFSANRRHITGPSPTSLPPATLRSARVESDAITRSGSNVHPFLYGHGSVPRAGNSFVSSIVHPGNNVRSHERIHQVSHATHHQQHPSNPPGMPPSVRRFNGPRGLPVVVPTVSQSDRSGGFYIFPPSGPPGRAPHEAENPLLNHNHSRERDHLSRFPVISFDRDSGWGSAHHNATGGGSDSSNRSGGFWQRPWS